MNKKLRRWLESRCRVRPDGSWSVEVPVVQAQAAGAVVLPDEAAKETYLAQAVRLGRFHLTGTFGSLSIGASAVAATGPVLANVPSEFVDAAMFALLPLSASPVLWLAVARSADKNFLRWVEELAVDEAPASNQVDRRNELYLCRPAWMIAAEALVFAALAVSMVGGRIVRQLQECARDSRGMGGNSTTGADSASGCIGAFDLFMLAMLVATMIGTAALLAANWWKWRRWNG